MLEARTHLFTAISQPAAVVFLVYRERVSPPGSFFNKTVLPHPHVFPILLATWLDFIREWPLLRLTPNSNSNCCMFQNQKASACPGAVI